MRRNLILAFVALQVIDVLSTNYVLGNGGYEGNPIMAHVIQHLGAWWWVAKMGLVLACVPTLTRVRLRWVAATVGLYAAVIINNLSQ